MSLTANTRLFARKGEASPAGVTVARFPAEKPRAPVEIEDDQARPAARAGAQDSGPATSLSFLIQRNSAAVGKASFGEDGDGVCQSSCPASSCGVSYFEGTVIAFGVQPDVTSWRPVARLS